jgi:hypothetical protein
VFTFAQAEGFEIIAEFTEVETGKGSDALVRRSELKAALKAAKKISAGRFVDQVLRILQVRRLEFLGEALEEKTAPVIGDRWVPGPCAWAGSTKSAETLAKKLLVQRPDVRVGPLTQFVNESRKKLTKRRHHAVYSAPESRVQNEAIRLDREYPLGSMALAPKSHGICPCSLPLFRE